MTADKQMVLTQGGYIANPGDKVMIFFEPDGTDGIDVSDCVVQVPCVVTDRSGRSNRVLNTTDLGITADLTPVANINTALGTGYTVPDGTRLQLGGGLLVISIEDDSA